jgi:SPP1 gp7 family putative phage head morphogenesis protein
LDEERIWKQLDRVLNRGEKQTIDAFKQALKEIREELSNTFERYAKEGALTQEIMNKYNRLGKLEAAVVEKLNSALNRSDRVLMATQITAYSEAFNRYMYAVSKEINFDIDFVLLRKETVKEAVKNPLEKIAKDRLKFLGRQRVRRAIKQGIIRGDSYPQMARTIRGAINGTTNDALRIVRTEGQRAAVRGQQKQAETVREKGIEIKEIWDASLDSRTRPEHGRMDGKEAKEHNGEMMFYSPDVGWIAGPVQSGVPSFDINCRCRVRMQTGEAPATRRAGDKGQREVIPYKTYSEWAKAKGVS